MSSNTFYQQAGSGPSAKGPKVETAKTKTIPSATFNGKWGYRKILEVCILRDILEISALFSPAFQPLRQRDLGAEDREID
jgi:hypothetical protein